MSSAQDTFDAQCEDKNCDVPRGHDGDHSDGIECWPRETKATNGAPYHVEGRTVVMTTRSGKSLPVAACDFLSAEYVCAALSAYWESENERGAMFAFEERGDGK